MIWVVIGVAALACYGLKYAGLAVPESVLQHHLTVRAATLIPVALLGALVAVQTFADEQALVVDTRLLGLGVACVLLLARAPFLVVVFGAALVAALVRML